MNDMTINLDNMTIVALVGARQSIKAQLELEEAAYEKKIAPLKDAVQKLEGTITTKMDTEGLDNVKTVYGTPYFTHPEQMRVVDRQSFFDWVLDNRAVDVLTSAVSKDAIRTRGEVPPGVEVTKIRKLCIRKPA